MKFQRMPLPARLARCSLLILCCVSACSIYAANPPPPKECAKAAGDLADLTTEFSRWKAVARRSEQREVSMMESRITTRKAYLAKPGDMQDVYQCQEMAHSIMVDTGTIKFKLPDDLALDKCIRIDGKKSFDALSGKYEAAKAAGQIGVDDSGNFAAIGTRVAQSKKDLADEGLKLPRCEAMLQEFDADGKALIAMQKRGSQAATKK